jgi:hypothetical protein
MATLKLICLCLLVITSTVPLLHGQAQWQNETPPLSGLAYGHGVYLAVAHDDTIWRSSDLIHWDNRQTGFDVDLNAVAFGQGVFVAVGRAQSTPMILTSSNGVDWARQQVPPLLQVPISDVYFLNNQFVATSSFVNSNTSLGAVLSSPDGLTWTLQYSTPVDTGIGFGPGLLSVAYGNGAYLAVGSRQQFTPPYLINGTVLYSTNLTTWAATNSVNYGLGDVVFGNGTFVVVGSGGAMTLTSGGWKTATGIAGVQSVAFGQGRFVAVGQDGSIASSVDGLAWTNHPSGTIANLRRVAFANKTFVVVGDGGTVLTSPDGQAWALLRSSGSPIQEIAFGGGTFVGLSVGTVLTSPDTVRWSPRYTSTNAILYTHAAYGSGRFVVVGGYAGTGSLLISGDSTNWQEAVLPTSHELSAVAMGNGAIVLGGVNGPLLTSTDHGESWQITDSEITSWNCIAWGNDSFLALGSTAPLALRSKDGLTWTPIAPSITPAGLTFGNGLFVAAVPGIFTSADGTSWVQRDSSADYNAITFANGVFVAVGQGIITTSFDGITWTVRRDNLTDTLSAVAFGNGLFATVGWQGTILISPLAPRLLSPTWLGNGSLQFRPSLDFAQPVALQASIDLSHWQTIATFPGLTNGVPILSPGATNALPRFFRTATTAGQ